MIDFIDATFNCSSSFNIYWRQNFNASDGHPFVLVMKEFIFVLIIVRWLAIALTTLLIRTATVPLLINQLKSTSKLSVSLFISCCLL